MTFDDALYLLTKSDQHVYGYFHNAAVMQMRADAYGPGMNDSALLDILRMPLLKKQKTSDINCNFDSFTDLEISSCTAQPEDIDTGDVHPALRSSQNTSNETQMNGSIPLQLHSKERKHCLAEISTAPVSDGPSNGVLTSARHDCFAPSVP
eukprot:209967-Rhodomonas_salina.1